MTHALSVKSGEQRRISSLIRSFGLKAHKAHSGYLTGVVFFLRLTKIDAPDFFDIETGQFAELPIELPEEMLFGLSALSPDEESGCIRDD